jgi:DNA-binding GntR family transcriptional regulator
MTTSSDQVYEELKRDILRGKFTPGSPLKERDLCSLMNVSRTPVREALQRLGREGLAEIRPGRSTIVAELDQEEINEIFALGAMLEAFVAGLAAEKATQTDIARLEDIVASMERVLADHAERSDYARFDHAFHEQLSAMARSKRVTDMLRRTVSFRLLASIFQTYEPVDFETSLSQHKTILRAIKSGDAEWATTAMRSHIMTGKSVGSPRR